MTIHVGMSSSWYLLNNFHRPATTLKKELGPRVSEEFADLYEGGGVFRMNIYNTLSSARD